MANDKGAGTDAALSQEKAVKDTFLDFKGIRSGIPVTRKLVIPVAASVLSLVLLSMLPLSHYGEKTALALGFLASVLILMIFARLPIIIPSIIIIVGGFLLGLWGWGDVTATLGSSPLYTMMGMMIVAMGAEFTPMGKRIAYGFLKLFGQKPTSVVIVLGITTALLSAFVSNTATIVLISSIAHGLLVAMKEEPGKSRIGRTLMLVVCAASMIGGIALISGSPVGNTIAISFMENASDGAYTVTYGQWAAMGVACLIAIAFPMCYTYIFAFRLKNADSAVLPQSYYDDLYKSLGPIGGSEIRWIVYVFGMVSLMIAGVLGTAQAAMLFALISMLPMVGTVPVVDVFKRLPFLMLMSGCMLPILAKLFTEHGLGGLMGDLITPLVGDFGPLAFSIFSAVVMVVLLNLFVNATQATSAMVISIVTPVCIAMGYNPTIILMPTLFVASLFFVFGMNTMMLLNQGYGYWEMKDPILPGTILVLLCAVVFPIICYVLGPMFGMPLYI